MSIRFLPWPRISHLNIGAVRPTTPKFPCSVCTRDVERTYIQCSRCKRCFTPHVLGSVDPPRDPCFSRVMCVGGSAYLVQITHPTELQYTNTHFSHCDTNCISHSLTSTVTGQEVVFSRTRFPCGSSPSGPRELFPQYSCSKSTSFAAYTRSELPFQCTSPLIHHLQPDHSNPPPPSSKTPTLSPPNSNHLNFLCILQWNLGVFSPSRRVKLCSFL